MNYCTSLENGKIYDFIYANVMIDDSASGNSTLNIVCDGLQHVSISRIKEYIVV